MIQSYIDTLKLPSNLSVVCISSATCLSSGDALREIDTMGVIRSDPFVLISGDVISNMDLKKAIKYHIEKRKADSNCVMTVVMKPIQKRAGLKPIYDDLIVALDKQTSQLILFEDNITNSSVNIPIELLCDHSDIVIRSDLLDCHVDICSPEVLLQFSDNFDYQVSTYQQMVMW
jgi:translation initiation factor eIF-2B subunit epsilon